MRQIGSQRRETLEEAGYILHKRISTTEVILMDTDSLKMELWFVHECNPGYTIEVEGVGYEFARSVSADEVDWLSKRTP